MADNGIAFEIRADARPLEAAIKKMEQLTDGLASKLDAGFGLLDVRIGLLRDRLVAVQDQVGRSGDAFSSFLKNLGAFFDIGAIELIDARILQLTISKLPSLRNVHEIRVQGCLPTVRKRYRNLAH